MELIIKGEPKEIYEFLNNHVKIIEPFEAKVQNDCFCAEKLTSDIETISKKGKGKWWA